MAPEASRRACSAAPVKARSRGSTQCILLSARALIAKGHGASRVWWRTRRAALPNMARKSLPCSSTGTLVPARSSPSADPTNGSRRDAVDQPFTGIPEVAGLVLVVGLHRRADRLVALEVGAGD